MQALGIVIAVIGAIWIHAQIMEAVATRMTTQSVLVYRLAVTGGVMLFFGLIAVALTGFVDR